MAFIAGLAQREITPEEDVYQAGYAARNKPSEGVHDPLFVKALYIEDGKNKIVLISLDLVSIPLKVIKKARQLIYEQSGLKNIIIACTHTHSGPRTTPDSDDDKVNKDWLKFMINSIVDVAQSSLNNKEPVHLGFEKIDVPDIGKNRRGNKDIVDPGLGVLKVENKKGKLKGLLLNFTNHCTVLDASNYLISADYPGYIYKTVAKNYPDTITLFTNGAAGDINIGYSADDSALGEKMDIRTYENAEKIGERLALNAINNLDNISHFRDEFLEIKKRKIKLPINEDLPSDKELRNRINKRSVKISNTSDKDKRKKMKIKQIYDSSLLKKKQNRAGEESYITSEIYIVSINGFNIVTVPGELFCKLGLEIKQLLGRGKTIIVGYANDYVSYIPTRSAFEEGGYEVETSIFSPEVGQELLNQIKQLITEG